MREPACPAGGRVPMLAPINHARWRRDYGAQVQMQPGHGARTLHERALASGWDATPPAGPGTIPAHGMSRVRRCTREAANAIRTAAAASRAESPWRTMSNFLVT